MATIEPSPAVETIWKFTLGIIDRQQLKMPAKAELLCVQIQYGTPCLWARVIPDNRRVDRTIYIHGTGHAVTDIAAPYIGTFQIAEGSLVFHVFDGGEE